MASATKRGGSATGSLPSAIMKGGGTKRGGAIAKGGGTRKNTSMPKGK